MKVNASVYQDPDDGNFIVHTELVNDDVQVGEFFLPGGMSQAEAEATARSLIRLAETGFDLRELVSTD